MELYFDSAMQFVCYCMICVSLWTLLNICVLVIAAYLVLILREKQQTRKKMASMEHSGREFFGMTDEVLLKLDIQDLKTDVWTVEQLQKLRNYAVSKSVEDRDKQTEWIHLLSLVVVQIYELKKKKEE